MLYDILWSSIDRHWSLTKSIDLYWSALIFIEPHFEPQKRSDFEQNFCINYGIWGLFSLNNAKYWGGTKTKPPVPIPMDEKNTRVCTQVHYKKYICNISHAMFKQPIYHTTKYLITRKYTTVLWVCRASLECLDRNDTYKFILHCAWAI